MLSKCSTTKPYPIPIDCYSHQSILGCGMKSPQRCSKFFLYIVHIRPYREGVPRSTLGQCWESVDMIMSSKDSWWTFMCLACLWSHMLFVEMILVPSHHNTPTLTRILILPSGSVSVDLASVITYLMKQNFLEYSNPSVCIAGNFFCQVGCFDLFCMQTPAHCGEQYLLEIPWKLPLSGLLFPN